MLRAQGEEEAMGSVPLLAADVHVLEEELARRAFASDVHQKITKEDGRR